MPPCCTAPGTSPSSSCTPSSTRWPRHGATGWPICSAARASDTSWLPESWSHVDDAAALHHLVPDIAENDVFVCGPDAWADAAIAALAAAGVPQAQVHLERFTY